MKPDLKMPTTLSCPTQKTSRKFTMYLGLWNRVPMRLSPRKPHLIDDIHTYDDEALIPKTLIWRF